MILRLKHGVMAWEIGELQVPIPALSLPIAVTLGLLFSLLVWVHPEMRLTKTTFWSYYEGYTRLSMSNGLAQSGCWERAAFINVIIVIYRVIV